MARAGALPLAGRECGRLLPVAAAAQRGPGTLACGCPASIYAPCRPLRHPPVAGRIARRGPRCGPLRPALAAASAGLARPEHPAAAPGTTGADPAAVVAENRRRGPPARTAPNQAGVGDITYLPLPGGRWCYLATWREACSRRAVGGPLAAHMPTEWVLPALEQALTLRQPAPGPLIHADRGSRYTGAACRARSAQAGALPSSRRLRPGNPCDNAPAEAGGSTLKTELRPRGGRLRTSKKPAWKSPIPSIPTSTWTAATPPSATARLTSLNATSKPTCLSLLSVFIRPPQHGVVGHVYRLRVGVAYPRRLGQRGH